MKNGTSGMIGDMKSYAPMGMGTSGTSGSSGGSGTSHKEGEFSDDTNIHVIMPREEYEDLLLMRQFIYDNGLVLQYEIFLDVLNGIEESKKMMESMVVEDDVELLDEQNDI